MKYPSIHHRPSTWTLLLTVLTAWSLMGCEELNRLFASPSVAIISPSADQTITGNSVEVYGTATDLGGVTALTYRLENAAGTSDERNVLDRLNQTTNEFRFTINDLYDGRNTVYVTATDLEGNRDQAFVAFNVEGGLTTEFGLVLNSPADGDTVTDSDVELTGTVTGVASLDTLVVARDGVETDITSSTDEIGSFATTISDLVEGENVITVTATPTTGDAVSLSLTITYEPVSDTVLFVEILEPENGDELNGDAVMLVAELLGPAAFESAAYVLNDGAEVELTLEDVLTMLTEEELAERDLSRMRIDGEGSGAEGSGTEGSGTEGSGTEGSGTEGSGEEGSGTEGSGEEGSGEEGSGEEGSGTEGSGEEGSGEEGSGTEGSGEMPEEPSVYGAVLETLITEGLLDGENTIILVVRDVDGNESSDSVTFTFDTGEEGSGTEGSGEEGAGTEGSGEEGSGTEGSGIEGSGEEGSGTEGSGEEGSGTEGSGEEGSGV